MAQDVRTLPMYLARGASSGSSSATTSTTSTTTRDSLDSHSPSPPESPNSLSTRLSFPQSVRSFATVTTQYQPPSPPPPMPQQQYYRQHQPPSPPSPPPRSAGRTKSLHGAAAARAAGQAARAAAAAAAAPKTAISCPSPPSRSASSATLKQYNDVRVGSPEQPTSPWLQVMMSDHSSPFQSATTTGRARAATTSNASRSPSPQPSPRSDSQQQQQQSPPRLVPPIPSRPSTSSSSTSNSNSNSTDESCLTPRPFPPRSLSGSLRSYPDAISAPYPTSHSSPPFPPSSASLHPISNVTPLPPSAQPISSIPPTRSERTRHASSPQPTNGSASNSVASPAAASFISSSSSTLHSISAKLQSAKLKDRFHAVGEQAKGWGGKGKGKLAESWGKAANGINYVAMNAGSKSSMDRPDSTQSAGAYLEPTLMNRSVSGGSADGRAPSPSLSLDGGAGAIDMSNPGIKLPSMILGVRVPRRSGMAFGVRLEQAVELSCVSCVELHRKRDDDPITGDEAKRWLPAVAYRCLEYLEEWGKKEEGIYRVPGRSNMVNRLRALFDAGMDKDLREIHPGDLDPHAVASLFKSWLRELPEPLLSSNLEAAIDLLSQDAIGYSASSSNFLSQQRPSPSSPPTGGLVDGRAPKPYLEKLRELFGNGMPAEHFHLLRCIAYHLARLASHSATNKMTLSNLRLILSPTLRLSPVFVQILVEEREILFGKTNEDARVRELALASPSIQAGGGGAIRTSSSSKSSVRSSPLMGHPPSPRLGSLDETSTFSPTTPTFNHEFQCDSAETLSAHALSPTLSSFPTPQQDPYFAPTPPPVSFRTPIAEKFAAVRASPVLGGPADDSPPLVSPRASSFSSSIKESSTSPTLGSKPAFVPSRNVVNGGGFFSASRDKSMGETSVVNPTAGRKTSDESSQSVGKPNVIASPSDSFQLDLPQGFGLGLSSTKTTAEDDDDPWGLLSFDEKKRFFSG